MFIDCQSIHYFTPYTLQNVGAPSFLHADSCRISHLILSHRQNGNRSSLQAQPRVMTYVLAHNNPFTDETSVMKACINLAVMISDFLWQSNLSPLINASSFKHKVEDAPWSQHLLFQTRCKTKRAEGDCLINQAANQADYSALCCRLTEPPSFFTYSLNSSAKDTFIKKNNYVPSCVAALVGILAFWPVAVAKAQV